MRKIDIKLEIERDKIIKLIFQALLLLISAPFITLFGSIRFTEIYTIEVYSMIAQFVGMSIIILSLLLIAKYKRASFKQMLPAIFIAIYLLLSLVSSILTEDRGNAFWGSYRGEGYYVYICYIGIALGAFLVTRHDKKLIGKLLKYLVFVSSVFAVVAILDKYFINIYDTFLYTIGEATPYQLPKSAFINSNYLGYYTAVTLMLSLHFMLYAKGKWMKMIFAVTSILISVASTISSSRGAILALMVGYALYILYNIIVVKDKRIIRTLLLLILARLAMDAVFNILVGGLYLSAFVDSTNGLLQQLNEGDGEGSFAIRLKMYLAAIELSKQRPLFGWGIDNIRRMIFDMSGQFKGRCHNEILQKFATIGIPATLCYISAIGIIFIRFLKSIKKQSPLLIGAFFAALIYFGSAQFGVSTPAVAPLFFVLMGVVYGATFNNEK